MTALALYKFVHNNKVEYHYNHDKSEVYLCVDIDLIHEFQTILGDWIMDENGIECTMKKGYFGFAMKDICDNFNFDLTEVFDNLEA